MKLKDPIGVRGIIMEKHGWRTVEEIAGNLSLAMNTASRALRGEPVRMTTAKAFADSIDKPVSEIAEYV